MILYELLWRCYEKLLRHSNHNILQVSMTLPWKAASSFKSQYILQASLTLPWKAALALPSPHPASFFVLFPKPDNGNHDGSGNEFKAAQEVEGCAERQHAWRWKRARCCSRTSVCVGLFRVEAIITIWNHNLVIMIIFFVYIYITFKQIELESPNCSGFEENLKSHHIGVLIIDQRKDLPPGMGSRLVRIG